jgi:PIN domain nuclease of toxin-antitoxin system
MGSDEVIVLDTHALVRADSDDRKLGPKARALVSRMWPYGKVAVPAIACWEVGLLQSRSRIDLGMSLRDWREGLLRAGVVELPLDGSVAVRALDRAGLHDDPADRFIVATALVYDACWVTAGERPLEWRHALERQDARRLPRIKR